MVLNLQNKLIMFTAGLIVLISLFFSTYLINNESTLLLNALEKRGETIANGIANNCQFSVLAEDRTSLGNFVESAMKEKDVSTVSIINKDGRFLSHNLQAKIDKSIETDIEKKALEAKDVSVQIPDDKTIVITVPIVSKVTQSSTSSGGSDLESMMGLGAGAGQSEKQSSAEVKRELIGAVQVNMNTTGISDELRKIKMRIFLFTLIIGLVGIVIIIGFSRITFNPLKQVIHKIQKISQGEIEEALQIKANDEIGDLGRAFNELVKYVEEIAQNARLVAQGELGTEITPLSERDVLGNAFKEMVGYLQEMAELAQNISQGNISGNIHPRSDKDILGVAFKDMVGYFQEMSQLAQEISQGNISGNIRVRSQFDVLGTSFKQIVEYLQEMANITQDVSRGNLTTAIKPRSTKDLIGNALSSMITGLRDLISQIQESSNQIHSRANEMASLSRTSSEAISQIQESSNQIHSRANEMASLSRTSSEAISQMASNVSQISVSITKISDTTQTVATVAQKAAKTAETGDENISGVIAKVSHSKESAYQSAELIKNLGKRSMQIGEIINYITKVADQTNLLSLNAAIEAARAGEAGRGFAVVADEVRKLAEGSAQSASEIARLISEVQAETAKAVAAVEVVAKDVGESATVTQDAGKSFKDISQAAKNIAGQIEDIAASSEETAASAEEASASSEEQVATFEEISTSIENLKEIAESLKDSASKFKLS